MRERWTRWTACLAMIGASLGLRAALLHTTGVDVLLRPLLVAVAIASLAYSPQTGMVVAVLGAILNYVALMRPRETGGFIIGKPELVELLLFVLSSWVISFVVALRGAHRGSELGVAGVSPQSGLADLTGPIAHVIPVYDGNGAIRTFGFQHVYAGAPDAGDEPGPPFQPGNEIIAAFPNCDHRLLLDRLSQVMATGKPSRFEISGSGDQDVAPETYELRAARIGRAVLLSWRSLTAERDVQRRLRLNEWRYRSLVQATAAIVWSTPASGEFDSEQPEWSAFTGQRFEELQGWGWLKAIHPEDRDRAAMAWSAAVAKRSLHQVEYRLRNREGEYRSMMVRAVPIISETGEVLEWVGVHTDISDLKQAEERLRMVNSTLERRVRERTRELEARSEQLRAMALDLAETESRERKRLAQILHDHFQQLLSAARLKVSVIRRKTPAGQDTESLRQLEDVLAEAISASRSLATELSPPILHDAGLIPALQWLARRMEQLHTLHIDLRVQQHCEPENEQLRIIVFECVRELLFNIHKHAGVDKAEMRVELSPQGLLHVQVADSGAGFDPDAPDPRAGGREGGFGLFSIRERLSLIGGILNIDSAPGKGTTIHLTVPCVVKTAGATVRGSAVATPRIARSGSSETPRLRVLIADDHRIFREGLVAMLSQEPYIDIVGQACDGEEALQLARQLRPDLLIVDVSMPHLNGVQVTAVVTREMPGTRVIGLSMHDQQDMARAMSEAGAMAYCPKSSAGDEELVNLLRAAAQGIASA